LDGYGTALHGAEKSTTGVAGRQGGATAPREVLAEGKGVSARRGLEVRERNNQVKVVILAIKDTYHDNIWEVELLCDSFEMHRI